MILVTGGTGTLGCHLLYELSRTGKKVRAIKRETSNTEKVRKIFSYYAGTSDELLQQIEWFDADLLDFYAVEDALEGVDEIYHCGAVVSFFQRDYKTMLNTNINGTANLVNLSRAKNIRKFCHVSSIATLGRADATGLINEESYWKPSRKNSIYSISKYGAEREVWRGMEEGLNAVIIQPSIILGPGFWEDNSGLFRLVWEGLRFYTLGINGFVDVRDVVTSMIGLMEKEKFGERFIISSENLSYQQLFAMIARHIGKPAPSIRVSPFLGAILWRAEILRALATGSKPRVSQELAITAMQEYCYSNDKIRKELGMEFKPVETTVREICGMLLNEMSRDK